MQPQEDSRPGRAAWRIALRQAMASGRLDPAQGDAWRALLEPKTAEPDEVHS
ncbi:MAG: hypothetical protein AAFY02_13860 [Pseudomonadota bacterium]